MLGFVKDFFLTMNTAGPFSADEFRTELGRFRELFGSKSFWARPQVNRQAAVNAIGFMYLNLNPSLPSDELDRLQVQWSSAIDEFTRREILCAVSGLLGPE